MSDIFERGQDLLSRFSSLKDRDEHLAGMITNEQLLLEKAQDRHQGCLNSSVEILLALETLKRAIVPLTERGLKRLKDLVSFGLLTIFHDCKYSMDVEVRERGNDKTAELWLLEETEDGTLRVKVRDSVGGGVKTVIALILRIFFILHYKQRRIVVMDEPFSDLATEYVDGLFQFLRYSVEELGFEWLIVTHDKRFLPYGNQTYRISKGTATLVQKTEEEDPSA